MFWPMFSEPSAGSCFHWQPFAHDWAALAAASDQASAGRAGDGVGLAEARAELCSESSEIATGSLAPGADGPLVAPDPAPLPGLEEEASPPPPTEPPQEADRSAAVTSSETRAGRLTSTG